MIEIGEREVQQQRRQRQDQDDQDRQHADRERDVAALQERADLAKAGQLDAAGSAGRCGGDVAHEGPLTPASFARCMVSGGLTGTAARAGNLGHATL